MNNQYHYNNILSSALYYSNIGWRVLPVRQYSKIPAIKNWVVDASSNPETVAKMFDNHNGNIGVACGSGSGIVVIDIDMPDGLETLKLLKTKLGPLPPTLIQKTGNNGQHLIFKYPAGHVIRGSSGTTGNGLGKNIDVRGEGSQIIVYPSIHENGNQYMWGNNLPIAELPSTWIERLENKPPQTLSAIQETDPITPNSYFNNDNTSLQHPYVETAIKNELNKICEAKEGERNDTLFKAGCNIGCWVPEGHLSYDEAHALLFQAAETNGYVQSDGAEAANKTIASGLNTGIATPKQIPSTPPGFSIITKGQRPGLYYTEKQEEGAPQKIWLGPPLHVLGCVRDDASECWGLLLSWNDPDDKTHKWILLYELLAGSDSSIWRSSLANRGWTGATGKQAKDLLARYLNESKPIKRILSVTRTGWHHTAFVFPDRTIYPRDMSGNSIILQEQSKDNPYKQGGSLDNWRRTIGHFAEGNSRLKLALCASLGAALLELTGIESGGFNWIGSSSTGKTTALIAASSIWGKGSSTDGYVLSWRSTDNALEAVAALHSDTALCLDELSQAPPGVVANAAYMLGNGRGKSRATTKGNARPTKNWRCMILSSGEQGLDDKLRSEGQRSRAGQAVRLIDIPADAGCNMGIFENLHDYPTPQAFADAIREASSINYGFAAQEFINKLTGSRIFLDKNIHDAISEIALSLAGGNADAQVQRVSKRFALCIVAGELATSWGIFPWAPGSANVAITKCFKAWLKYRGGNSATEDMQIIKQVTLFIEQHGNSRFQPIASTGNDIYHNRVGFKDTKNNQTIYYVFPESFASEVCNGFDTKKAAKVLEKAGILIIGEEGRLQTKPPKDLPGWGRKRCYVLSFATSENDE